MTSAASSTASAITSTFLRGRSPAHKAYELAIVKDPWHFSADSHLWLMDLDPTPDPAPEPTPFFSDFMAGLRIRIHLIRIQIQHFKHFLWGF